MSFEPIYFNNESDYTPVDFTKQDRNELRGSKSFYKFKRVHHFQNFINCFKDESIHSIPNQVLRMIRVYLHKRGVDLKATTQKDILDSLIELKLLKYKTWTYPIYLELANPKEKIFLDKDLERFLRQKFIEIEGVSSKIKGNLPPYSYIAYKLADLYGDNKIKHVFVEPLSKYRVFIFDIYWKKVCSQLGWDYKSTNI